MTDCFKNLSFPAFEEGEKLTALYALGPIAYGSLKARERVLWESRGGLCVYGEG